MMVDPDSDSRSPGEKKDPNLDNLRSRIRELDLEIVARAAERVEVARRIGQLKRSQKLSTIEYAQERVVLERARVAAEARGLDPADIASINTPLVEPIRALQRAGGRAVPGDHRAYCAHAVSGS